jgi:beta-N-acetylhexosaminidase
MQTKRKLLTAFLILVAVAGALLLTPLIVSKVNQQRQADADLSKQEGLDVSRQQQKYESDQTLLAGFEKTAIAVESRISKMSKTQKAGGVMMIAIPDQYLSQNTIDFLNKYQISGVILMGSNIYNETQTKQLVADLHSKPDHRVAVAVDQEGSPVARIFWEKHAQENASQLGKADNLDQIKRINLERAQELHKLGIDLNFAPVADLAYGGSWITSRSFGSDPQQVSAMVITAVSAQEQGGVMPTVKHYPGLGRTGVDSHLDLPVVNASKEQLEATDLLPFKAAIKANVPAVMVGHVLYTQLDPDYPASISSKILNGELRGTENFKGLIITDDMKMGALNGFSDKYARAVNAGIDLDLVIESYQDIGRALKQIESGVPDNILDSHLRRIYRSFN